MRQFYFGNRYVKEGYGTLAYDPVIPSDVRAVMRELAATGVDSSDDEKRGVVMLSGCAIVYCVKRVTPRVELGEMRPTYFSHQYYIEGPELDQFMENMPGVLQDIRFDARYADEYDIEPIQLPTGAYYPSGTYSDIICNAENIRNVEKVLGKAGHILIHSSDMNYERAYKTAVEIIGAIDPALRKKASFTAIESSLKRTESTDRAAILFCNTNTFESLINYYNKDCIYYNADKGKLVLTDPDIEPKPGPVKKGGEKLKMEEYAKIEEHIKNINKRLNSIEKNSKNNKPILLYVIISAVTAAVITLVATTFAMRFLPQYPTIPTGEYDNKGQAAESAKGGGQQDMGSDDLKSKTMPTAANGCKAEYKDEKLFLYGQNGTEVADGTPVTLTDTADETKKYQLTYTTNGVELKYDGEAEIPRDPGASYHIEADGFSADLQF